MWWYNCIFMLCSSLHFQDVISPHGYKLHVHSWILPTSNKELNQKRSGKPSYSMWCSMSLHKYAVITYHTSELVKCVPVPTLGRILCFTCWVYFIKGNRKAVCTPFISTLKIKPINNIKTTFYFLQDVIPKVLVNQLNTKSITTHLL